MQYLLDRARWDANAVQARLSEYIKEELGSRDAVLVLDETGFLKKGLHSAGVQRQYSGTAGRIENSQVGVFLCYAGERGYVLLDRELYLPQQWIEDGPRCRGAGIPEEIDFQTKPMLGRRMLERAFAAGMACGWVAGDEVYGHDGKLRRWLEERHQPYVLAVSSDQRLWRQDMRQHRVDEITSQLPQRGTTCRWRCQSRLGLSLRPSSRGWQGLWRRIVKAHALKQLLEALLPPEQIETRLNRQPERQSRRSFLDGMFQIRQRLFTVAMASLLAPYGNPDALEVARELDAKVEAL